MLDKFIALNEDKCLFTYQLMTAMGATHVVEAGTNFGVSTIYLALAVRANMERLGKGKGSGKVIATEKEESKAQRARGYWRECGEMVESVIELRVGNLRETLRSGVVDDGEGVDLLLLDSEFLYFSRFCFTSPLSSRPLLPYNGWRPQILCTLCIVCILYTNTNTHTQQSSPPLALPTLKLIQPRLRPGAVVLTDNTISSAEGYKDLLNYLRAEGSGFANMTLPFTNGFEMSVYMP